jgi:SAM-dependent methyltransferase
LRKLPFDDESFDLATAVCVYHHVVPEARPGLTAEIARILRPGGVACIIEHNPMNPATQIIVRRLPVDRDAQLLTWNTAHRLLAAAGLAKLQTTHFLFFPEKVYRRASRLEAALARVPLGGQYAAYASKPPKGGNR